MLIRNCVLILSKRNNMKKQFVISDDDLKELLEACKPVPYITDSFGNALFGNQQENANAAWRKLGVKYGFVWDSCEPIKGKGSEYFMAISK